MGIRLDWEIESEREQVRSAGEDAEARKRRGRALRRLLIVLLLLIAVGGGLILLVQWRLNEADREIRQALVTTVENEVAALRVGDRPGFSAAQRSDSAAWLQDQQDLFDAYQNLKATRNVTLSGRVLDAAVEGSRARVQVEEIIDGVPYVRTWFYWRYDDGWRHAPPDYTFWGEARTTELPGMTIRYFAVDAPFAAALGDSISRWQQEGCVIVACAGVPPLNVEIVPDPGLNVGWSAEDPSLLRVPSPYTGAALLDAPFTPELQVATAGLIAERLVAAVQPAEPLPTADARYLRQAVISWLVKRSTGIETNAFSIESLAQNYGEPAVGRLLSLLLPDANATVLSAAAGVPSLDQLTLDWRDYLTWRLTLEQEVIAARDDSTFLSLYDANDPLALETALARYSAGATGETWVVTEAVPETDASGVPSLRALATVRAADGTERVENVRFRLAGGVWRRTS